MSHENDKIGFVFPGQGTQKRGMGEKILQQSEGARRVFEEASDVLHLDMRELCVEDPNNLLKTSISPVAIITVNEAHRAHLEEEDIVPDVVAGHSLGEYSAMRAAKILSFPDELAVVKFRGEIMDEAGTKHPGAMSAVIRLSHNEVEEICHEAGVSISNENSPSQFVISGNTDNILKAEKLAKDHNGRTIRLPIPLASHSPLMEEAQQKLVNYIKGMTFRPPECGFIANVTGTAVTRASDISRYLKKHLTNPVLWTQTVRTMQKEGVNVIYECGESNSILSRLIGEILGSENSNEITILQSMYA